MSYCDTYNCEYLYEEPHHSNESIYYFLDAMCVLSLALLGGVVVTQIGLLGYTLYKSTNLLSKISIKLDEPSDRKIKIIRGVPGVGKRNYIYYLESGLNRKYIICDWNNYFIKDGKYCFNGKETSKAESHCLTTFLNAIDNDVKRIYVIGNFNEKWQYNNYITIGKLSKYKVKVTELECKNEDQLRYFNSRSSHNIPYSKSLKVYESWEADEKEYKRTPYIDTDKADELTCLINSSENDSESDSAIDNKNKTSKNSNTLPHKKTFDSPENREISFISENDILNLKEAILKSYQEINEIKVFEKNEIILKDSKKTETDLEDTNKMKKVLEDIRKTKPDLEDTNKLEKFLADIKTKTALEDTNKLEKFLEDIKKTKTALEDSNKIQSVLDDTNKTESALEDRNYNNSPINIEHTYVL